MAGRIAAEPNLSKLGRLQSELPAGLLASASWLGEHGYYRQLLDHYVSSGWLESPARGVYRRPGPPLKWQHVVTSLLLTEKLPLHIGGATVLEHAGFGHYARMRGAETIKLFGPTRLPAWARALPLAEKFVVRNDAMFRTLPVPHVFLDENGAPTANGLRVSDTSLAENGLRVARWGESDWPLVYSTEERAILEMLQDVPEGESVYQAHVMLQAMVNVRPAQMSLLLRHCGSIKVKRLFLALAERHRHAWFTHLELAGVELGKGKRALYAGGRLDPKYRITLPADLDDHAR
jgi:Transcriptional regulator, AbiEi antitoxin, Type IV TA system/Transcriptional regulator, AbiEi antitoxin N-terminal domain